MGRKKQIDYAHIVSNFDAIWIERTKLSQQNKEREEAAQSNFQRMAADWFRNGKSKHEIAAEKFFADVAEEIGEVKARRIFLKIAKSVKPPRGQTYHNDDKLLALSDEVKNAGGTIEGLLEALCEKKSTKFEGEETEYNEDGEIKYKPNEYGKSPGSIRKRIDTLRAARDQFEKDMKDLDVF